MRFGDRADVEIARPVVGKRPDGEHKASPCQNEGCNGNVATYNLGRGQCCQDQKQSELQCDQKIAHGVVYFECRVMHVRTFGVVNAAQVIWTTCYFKTHSVFGPWMKWRRPGFTKNSSGNVNFPKAKYEICLVE